MGVIVEFNGLTGCGKTTLRKDFLDILGDDGQIYYETIEAGKSVRLNLNKYAYKNFSIRHLSLGWLVATVRYVFLWFMALVMSNNQSLSRKKRYLKKGLLLWIVYRIFEKDCEDRSLLLVDEGIICSLASLIHTGRYSNLICKDIVRSLAYYKNAIIVNFEVDFDWSYHNIRNRKANSRFDKMSEEDLAAALKCKAELFLFLQELTTLCGLNILSIQSQKNRSDNANMLREKINERVN